MPVARNTDGRTVNKGVVYPQQIIEFPWSPLLSAPAQTASFFGVGTMLTGGSVVMFSGLLKPAIMLSNGAAPH